MSKLSLGWTDVCTHPRTHGRTHGAEHSIHRVHSVAVDKKQNGHYTNDDLPRNCYNFKIVTHSKTATKSLTLPLKHKPLPLPQNQQLVPQ
jgi:hypothetical protein